MAVSTPLEGTTGFLMVWPSGPPNVQAGGSQSRHARRFRGQRLESDGSCGRSPQSALGERCTSPSEREISSV